MLPHLGVHGGREDDRTAGGEQGVREEVVGDAVGRLGEHVGRRRGHDDEVGVLPDADVGHLVDVRPDLGGDGVAGERGPGGGADEVQGRLGRYDAYVMTGLGQPTQQLTGLVRGDAATDPQYDLGLVHRASPLSKTFNPMTHHRPDSRAAGPGMKKR